MNTFTQNFASLNAAEIGYLAGAVTGRFSHFSARDYSNGEEFQQHATESNLDQADVVMSLVNDPSDEARTIIEKLIDPNKITTEAPKTEATQAPRNRTKAKKTDPRVIATVAPNPKREGSASHARYENYKTGITVSQAIELGLTMGDINHDLSKGFITLEEKA